MTDELNLTPGVTGEKGQKKVISNKHAYIKHVAGKIDQDEIINSIRKEGLLPDK